VATGTAKNFVIVPLILRNRSIGIYLIHTQKPQQDFSNQDIQLLSVLANQAAAGVENWRTYEELVNANKQLKLRLVGNRSNASALGEIPAFDLQRAHALYAALLAPVEPGWQSARALLVVPLGHR
jgi:GAF domain-containing protein